MNVWESVVLGFVQGATEFLPVSSSGHLVITETVLGVDVPGVLYEVALHVATLLSILVVYRQRIAELATGLLARERDAVRYVAMIVVATVPAGVIGVLGGDAIERLFDTPATAGVALLVTGLILWSSKAALPRATGEVDGWGVAFLIGCAQAFALVPGISRSGTTVVAALWLGIEAREAAAFSFLMAVPAIAGAAVLQLPELAEGTALSTSVLLAGGAVAALTGILAIRTFVAMLARSAFHLFAPYCWLAGAGFLAFLWLR